MYSIYTGRVERLTICLIRFSIGHLRSNGALVHYKKVHPVQCTPVPHCCCPPGPPCLPCPPNPPFPPCRCPPFPPWPCPPFPPCRCPLSIWLAHLQFFRLYYFQLNEHEKDDNDQDIDDKGYEKDDIVDF